MPNLIDDLSQNLYDLNNKFNIYKNEVDALLTNINHIQKEKSDNNDKENSAVTIGDDVYLITHDNVLMKYKNQDLAKVNYYLNNATGNWLGWHNTNNKWVGMELKKCNDNRDGSGADLEDDEIKAIQDNSFVFLDDVSGYFISKSNRCANNIYYTNAGINIINNNVLYYDQYIRGDNSEEYYIDTFGYFHKKNIDDNSFKCNDDYRTGRNGPDKNITVKDSSGNISDYHGDCRYQYIFKNQIEDATKAETDFYDQFKIVLEKYNQFNLSENDISGQIIESRGRLKAIIDQYNDLKQDIDKNNKLKHITNAQKKDMKSLNDHMQFKMATTSIFGIIFILLLFNFIKK